MSRIRGADTRPERAVRALLRRMGLRPQTTRRDLPGTPDLVLPRRRIVIFVNGCFWHRHPKCKYAYTPKSNVGFWTAKFRANRQRDKVVRHELLRLAWRPVVVWECELRNPDILLNRLKREVRRTARSRGSS